MWWRAKMIGASPQTLWEFQWQEFRLVKPSAYWRNFWIHVISSACSTSLARSSADLLFFIPFILRPGWSVSHSVCLPLSRPLPCEWFPKPLRYEFHTGSYAAIIALSATGAQINESVSNLRWKSLMSRLVASLIDFAWCFTLSESPPFRFVCMLSTSSAFHCVPFCVFGEDTPM